VRAIYCANFDKDLDISSHAVVEQCLTALGQDGATIIEAAQMPAAKEKLRAQTAEAMQRGLFGAPSFMVGSELFWGNDRLEEALDWSANSGPATRRSPN
jgi:2-hydroxychromene-2-carboxylate isomerase